MKSPANVGAAEPSDAARRRSCDIAVRILENLAERDARLEAGSTAAVTIEGEECMARATHLG